MGRKGKHATNFFFILNLFVFIIFRSSLLMSLCLFFFFDHVFSRDFILFLRSVCSNDNFKVSCDWSRVSFSRDTSRIAAGSNDGAIFIWNINGQLEGTLKENS